MVVVPRNEVHVPSEPDGASLPIAWAAALHNKLPLQPQRRQYQRGTPTTASMDFASLKDQVANLTLYDLKAGVRKVQNGETPQHACIQAARLTRQGSGHELHRDGVKGARGNKQRTMGYGQDFLPSGFVLTRAGASSTLMQEIANATFN